MGVSHSKLEEEFAALGPIQASTPVAPSKRSTNVPSTATPANHVTTLRLDLQHVLSSSTDEGSAESSLFSEFGSMVSMIYPHLFLGGSQVAASRELLKQYNITQVVNCSHCIIPNYFEHDPIMTYLSINLHDKKEESIHWFVAGVIQFIELGRKNQRSTLLHCEKGISRSCAFAIAYHMWCEKTTFTLAFSHVKQIRPICNPNSGFLCNLIELESVFRHTLLPDFYYLFRCAFHSEYDRETAVLKVCLDESTRKPLLPSYPLFKSEGVYVICPMGLDHRSKSVYIWRGRNAIESAMQKSIELCCQFEGVLCDAAEKLIVEEGEEPAEFKAAFDTIPVCGDMRELYDFNDLYHSEDDGPISTHIPRECNVSVEIAPLVDQPNEIRKPRLYTLSGRGSGCGGQWSDLGMYDDSDLDEVRANYDR